MTATNHLIQRMAQRGISKQILEKTLLFGKNKGEKIIIDKKMVNNLLHELDLLKKDFLKIADKGGVTIVVSGDSVITTYNTNSFNRNRKG